MNKGKFFGLLSLSAILLVSTVINIGAQTRSYSGRAAGVIVLGPNATSAVDTGPLASSGGTLTTSAPSVNLPGITTGPVSASTSGAGSASQSSTSVTNARVNAGGYLITVASASSFSQCICCPGSVEGGCTTTSSITGVTVTDPSGNTTPITVDGRFNQVVTINGVGTITFNERATGFGSITLNAVHIDITSGGTNTNVILASAYSDIVCGATGPSSSIVSVAGRVVSSSGLGIAGATVTLTASTGAQLSARSNSTGNFVIQSAVAGQSYIVEASAKSYTFESQFITVLDEVTDLEIRANP